MAKPNVQMDRASRTPPPRTKAKTTPPVVRNGAVSGLGSAPKAKPEIRPLAKPNPQAVRAKPDIGVPKPAEKAKVNPQAGRRAPDKNLSNRPAEKPKVNAATQKARDDRAAWVKANPGKRYVKPVKTTAPATGGGKATTGGGKVTSTGTGRTTTSRGSTAPKKTGVNAQTQAIRDDRAEAKAKGQRYSRSNAGLSDAAKKMRADAGVNEVLMNRRLTIRNANRRAAAAKSAAAKAESPKDAETGNANAESEQQAENTESNSTSTSEAKDNPPKPLNETEAARKKRLEEEAKRGG